MARFRDLFRNRNFLFLWFGQVVSNFGDRLNQMALVALVYQHAPESEMALAKLISFTIIPVFIIGPIAGAWVDRLNKKHVMVVSDMVRGVLVLLIPLFIVTKQILLIYLIIFIVFSLSRFFIPSKMAIIPDIVPKEKFLMANTLQETTRMIGNVVGLVVAGIIVNIACIGAIGGFYIDAATFFISAAFIGMMVYRKHAANQTDMKDELDVTKKALEQSLRKSLFREVKDGMAYITKYEGMRFIVAISFLLLAGVGAISCVVIVFIQNAFGTSTRDLGLIGMFLVCGLFAGTLLYGKIGQKRNRKKVIYYSFAASGIALMLFTVFVRHYPNIVIAGTAAALLGGAVSPIMAAINTLTHELISEDMRGRIFSTLEAVIHFSFLICMFAASYLAQYIDRFWIITGVGVLFLLAGIAGIFRTKRKIIYP